MAEINLLPLEEKKKFPYIFILMGCIIMAFIILFFTFNYIKLQEELKSLDFEILKLETEIDEFDLLKLEVDELERKISHYQAISNDKTSFTELFLYISEIIPENTWITQFQMKDNTYLMLEGYSASLSEISQFISKLNEFNNLDSVRISSATEHKTNNTILINFEIIGSFKKVENNV